MNHIIRKNSFQGAGFLSKLFPKKQKVQVQPAVLRPPQLGSFEIANSYSIAEIIDLISDGPIEGLVDQNGQLLKGSSILKGIYLDNTPIQVTNDSVQQYSNDSLVLYKAEQKDQNGITFFSSLVREIALNSYAENSAPKLKYLLNNTLLYSPFFGLTFLDDDENMLGSLLASQFGFNSQNETILNTSEANAGFRPLTTNEYVDASMEQISFEDPSNTFSAINSLSSSNWYIVNYSYESSPTSTTIFAKNQETSKTRWEIHYTKDTLSYDKNIITEYKNLLKKLKESINDDIYESYLDKLENFVNEISNYPLGASGGFFLWGDSPYPNSEIFLVLKVGTYSSSSIPENGWISFENGDNKNKTITQTTKLFKAFLDTDLFPNENVINLLIPEVAKDNSTTGRFCGLLILKINLTYKQESLNKTGMGIDDSYKGYFSSWSFDKEFSSFVKKDISLTIQEDLSEEKAFSNSPEVQKYNFGDVLCEFKDGKEIQEPLTNFKNIYVDHDYDMDLFGPFRFRGKVTKIKESSSEITTFTAKQIYETASSRAGGIPSLNESTLGIEGSSDSTIVGDTYRAANGSFDYSNWNDKYEYNEKAIPVVHTIENPNVKKIFFTLSITSLKDTLSTDLSAELKAGDPYPAILVIQAEWGKIKNGEYLDVQTQEFWIIAQVHGQMYIDLGSPSLINLQDHYSYIHSDKGFEPFNLPDLTQDEDPTTTKRYLKVTKVSTETNSVLINREVSLSKVTEIIENDLSYPNSSIVGIKLDARTFSSVPERSFDCKLKKIKIPSNYNPINYDGRDKRYIKKASEYTKQNQIYVGDWDGNLVDGWTDNPAWILFDLLTNKRYGLGNYVEESQINIWELYKIGRFCDAVDEDGLFVGVSDGVGGLEPRYSCNVLFKDSIKLFDAINTIANLFRGVVFFSNSEIHFLDDRPRIPISMFSNTNVKGGDFNYTNYRRDQQYNTVEVAYLDRFDNYKTKIEYVEDEIDIRKRGVFKTTINTVGVTSRAMARRIGQHIIHQTLKENQGVEFVAGLESLLCRPGDLIVIEDELKTRSVNYGRVLDVDTTEKTVYIENSFQEDSFTGKLTVYTPTGYLSSKETKDIAERNRFRMPWFSITGHLSNSMLSAINTGNYYFSGYITGYPKNYAETQKVKFPTVKLNYPTEFPFYTGKHVSGHDIFAFYLTGFTGWVFSTGAAFLDNITNNQCISQTGCIYLSEIISGYRYAVTAPTRRGGIPFPSGIKNLFYFPFEERGGILDSEINLTNISQLTSFDVTGWQNLDYGSKLYVNKTKQNINLLNFVEPGSSYRIQRKNAADQIYKVVSIREENQNEYRVIASKYDTGKFEKIENFKSEDFLPDTYYSGPSTVANKQANQLAKPFIKAFGTGDATASNFQLTGSWNITPSCTGYELILTNSTTQRNFINTTTNTNYIWSGLNDIGRWDLQIRALGNKSTSWDSEYSKTGTFVVYQSITQLPRPAILNITILK